MESRESLNHLQRVGESVHGTSLSIRFALLFWCKLSLASAVALLKT